ncbi:uncharacterized protein TRIREDRAFT_102779 [Trichoderma reesei QM6a]|uniref:Predicted protein n=2 Tax=Hypocrea jecorina TaxID=51453 RepID=G0R890_HYPJQ|nr:uncharacterized protein TRIREDRAFT_102779 [Trichoderma reesei QM6a]EGR52311.1 predicted protein [Trichoderma reesei QM6a]
MGSSKASDAAPPPRPSRGWDATAHEALLLCIIDEVKGGKALMTEVTKKMQARGYTYSYDAINQHVQKLRKSRDTAGIVAASSEPGAATPRKSATPTPRKRRSAKKEIDDMDDALSLKLEQHEDEEMGSPCERPRKRGKSLLSAQINALDNETKLENEDGY